MAGRSPHGERGLKSASGSGSGKDTRRSPHGERGLKSLDWDIKFLKYRSLPAWGAWIEIVASASRTGSVPSLPAWGAWIEIGQVYNTLGVFESSLPAWGAWIEMPYNPLHTVRRNTVAPRMGSVD